jgi:hypothetical protein
MYIYIVLVTLPNGERSVDIAYDEFDVENIKSDTMRRYNRYSDCEKEETEFEFEVFEKYIDFDIFIRRV